MGADDRAKEGLPFEAMFALDDLGADRFRTSRADARPKRVFGGQLLGQALAAGLETVDDDRTAHAMQAQFRQAGRSDACFDLEVERASDGRSFSSRTIQMSQGGSRVLTAMASFQVDEDGLEFQPPMPDVQPAGMFRSEQEMRRDILLAHGKDEAAADALSHLRFEMRPTVPQNVLNPAVLPPYQRFWARPLDPVPASAKKRQAMLAYLSDVFFLSTTLHPHGVHWLSTPMHWASLNHSVWFHRTTDFSGWHLWSIDAVWTGKARAVARGSLYDAQGRLIMSAMQEGLARLAA